MGQWLVFWRGPRVGQRRSTNGSGGRQGLGLELYLLRLLEKSSMGNGLLGRRGSPLWRSASMP